MKMERKVGKDKKGRGVKVKKKGKRTKSNPRSAIHAILIYATLLA